jgi:hypothetical protein
MSMMRLHQMIQKTGVDFILALLMSKKSDLIQHHYMVVDNNSSLHLDMLFDFKDFH